MNPLLAILHRFSPLSPSAQEALLQIIQYKEFPNKTELLPIGKVARNLYFIQRGLGRVYYYKDEVDVTDYFAQDNQFIGAVSSLFTGQPSRKGIQLLEPSQVYYLAYQDFVQLGAQYSDIERAGGRLAIFAFLEAQTRLESIQFLSAQERYQELNQQYPGLLNRAPLKHVASYLGITQVSLSRIRAQV
ncbi:Crp/Fnr family transcriptional regulator [Adhaeribacter rhizoryzae]|uniref:Crp/Fnr family transcriptional regulator n=1 Tax=Adhaeribacter rhizoryzae TaxID=2607907 RepID=A0A5M6D7M2_9BACT|nr:Crp/Fnr family transcriptional regulator [Adhaeribacter rhizoryzae]KAA5543558.1 Crp/Fnr family transcriptional regulator [Adhaeribacter rhizoryzae]